jgi:hypothetical protein
MSTNQGKRVLRRSSSAKPWGLWRVEVKGGGSLGYLVTKNIRKCPHPIAFTLGTSAAALAAALRIYATVDQRKTRRNAWRKWVGFCLIPVDSRGRRISNQTFCAGQYTADGFFGLATWAGLDSMEGYEHLRRAVDPSKCIAITRENFPNLVCGEGHGVG